MTRIKLPIASCVVLMGSVACSSGESDEDDSSVDAGADAALTDAAGPAHSDDAEALDADRSDASPEASAVVTDASPELDADTAVNDSAPDGAVDAADAAEAAVDAECPVEQRCSVASERCLGSAQRLVCAGADTCGERIECWSGPCAEQAGQVICLPAMREGDALQEPQPEQLASSYVLLQPVRVSSDAGTAVAVRLAVEAADAATQGAFGLYRGVVDAFGPRPAEQLAWTGVVSVPATAGDHDFRLLDGGVPLAAEETYWVSASFEQARVGWAGAGALTMYYRSVAWDSGRVELPADFSAFPASKLDNASPLGLWLLTRPR